MDHSQLLAQFAARLEPATLSPETVERARVHILDTLGVCLGGSTTDHVRPVLEVVKDAGTAPRCTVVGQTWQTDVLGAALLNGLMGHSIDFDDGHRFVHPGAAVVPAALAIAEQRHLSGAALIAAVVVGYEVSVRTSLAAGAPHRRRGYHPTGTCNTLGAAAAVASALGLDADRIAAALAVAASQAGGISQYRFDGSPIKHLHAGLAARGGALAALLAERGFPGTRQPLEGEFGLLSVMSDGGQPEELTAGLDTRPLAIAETDIKPYPSCRQTHAPIDLALEAVHEHGLRSDDIVRIELEIYEYAHKSWLVSTEPPRSPLQAMLSIPYCIAVALRAGRVALDQFAASALADPEVQALARRVSVSAADDLTRAWPEQRGVRLHLHAGDDRTLRLAASNPRGGRETPLPYEEVTDKFRGLAEPVLGAAAAGRVIDSVNRLETLRDAAELARALARRPVRAEGEASFSKEGTAGP